MTGPWWAFVVAALVLGFVVWMVWNADRMERKDPDWRRRR